ncbi:hypothetical protein B296_00041315 [Ensete ventricosum]|uniref:Uncharacterized protein n=1 Tax=Ensete ventricosum TaxID=4639 RepID=A0A426Z1T3_ENSVE|nr:hypothetical protein B296_00041315 [Ensete ventricosum]
MPAPRTESRSPSEVQEILTEEATRRASEEETRGAPDVPSKHRAMDSVAQRKKSKDSSRHKLHHKADRFASRAAKGKGPAGPAEETPTPRPKSRLVKELCHPGVDGWGYHAIRMSSLSECALDAPLEMDLASLTHGAGIWLDGEASRNISEPHRSLGWLLTFITSMDNKVDLLRKEVQRLKEGGDPDAVATVEARASDAQSLADNLQIELDEASRHRESVEMELGEAQEKLANLRR